MRRDDIHPKRWPATPQNGNAAKHDNLEYDGVEAAPEHKADGDQPAGPLRLDRQRRRIWPPGDNNIATLLLRRRLRAPPESAPCRHVANCACVVSVPPKKGAGIPRGKPERREPGKRILAVL